MCDCCEQQNYPLRQVLIRLVNGTYRWYAVCCSCWAAFEREAEQ